MEEKMGAFIPCGPGICIGTNADEDFVGTDDGSEQVISLGGDDTIELGSDGSNHDEAHGGKGMDTIWGDKKATEVITPDSTADITYDSDITLSGDAGNDTIYGDIVRMELIITTSDIFNLDFTFGDEKVTDTLPNGGIYGGKGNDMLFGDLDSLEINATGEKDSDDPMRIRGNKFFFGMDTIYGGDKDDDIFGDLQTLTIIGTGPDNTVGEDTGFVFIERNTFNFGSDKLVGGKGIDKLYGDLKTLTIVANGGDGALGFRAGEVFIEGSPFGPQSMKFGDDKLFGNDGDDKLFGDISQLTWTANAGGGTAFGEDAGHVTIAGLILKFGEDVLIGHSGEDKIYGDVESFSLTANGGDNILAPDMVMTTADDVGQAEIDRNEFEFGDDKLVGESGADQLFGDIDSLDFVANGGDDVTAEDNATANDAGVAFVNLNVLVFGADELFGGKGNDLFLVGDVNQFTWTANGGDDVTVGMNASAEEAGNAEINANTVEFGADKILGDDGADNVFGDVDVFTIEANGGDGDSGEGAGTAGINISDLQPEPEGPDPFIIFGDDIIQGGNGADELFGDLNTLRLEGNGGFEVTGDFAGGASIGMLITFGQDTIKGGGRNDLLYGDANNIMFVANGGDKGSGVAAGEVFLIFNLFNFGDDFLDGGDRDDSLFGDANTITFEANGGSNATEAFAGNATITLSGFNFGDDTLKGGSSSGADLLYGDIKELKLMTTDGTGIVGDDLGDGVIAANAFFFGDDKLFGGESDDFLVGDFEKLTLVADIVMVEDDDIVVITDEDDNEITFGNDQFTGGTGEDTFSFTLLPFDSYSPVGDDSMIMQGNDMILDFEFVFSKKAKSDTLEFRDVIDVNGSGSPGDINDLDEVTEVDLIDRDGDGFIDDLIIQFLDHNGADLGSVAFIDFIGNPTVPLADKLVPPTSVTDTLLNDIIDVVGI